MALEEEIPHMSYFLTKRLLEELKQELEELKTKKRMEISEKLRQAKELGDLSENSEYLEAREEQTWVEREIAELEEITKNAVLIKEGGIREVVDLGATVEVARDKQALKFVIVGTNEAQPDKGFISNESPLGRMLMGKKAGESVIVQTPGGQVKYKIRKIS